MTHGTRASYVHGCRCDQCRQANTDYIAEWRARPVDRQAVTHGTTAYSNARCRCDMCRAAKAEWRRNYYRRRKAAS